MLLRNTGPAKAPLQLGISASAAAPGPGGLLLVGSGDGTVALMSTAPQPSAASPKKLKPMGILASVRVEGSISSIVVEGLAAGKGALPRKAGGSGGSVGVNFTVLVGTAASNIYRVVYDAVART